MQPALNIVIADDEWLEVEALRHLLQLDSRARVVGTARDGHEAVKVARLVKPDLVFMDIRMPGADGLQATRIIREEQPDVQVVIVTAHGEFDYARQAMSGGASSYLLKPVQQEELASVVTRVQQALKRQETERFHREGDLLRSLIQGRSPLPTETADRLALAVRSGESAVAASICQSVATEVAKQPRPQVLAVLTDMLNVLTRAALAAASDTARVDTLRGTWIDRITVAEGGAAIAVASGMGASLADLVAVGWTSGSRALVARARAFVDAHYVEEISLESVAAHIPVNSSYLSRVFRKETGQSFVDYVSDRRLERSLELLCNPDLTIGQVADRVGFRSAGYFTTVFRQRLGRTPGEFRRSRQTAAHE